MKFVEFVDTFGPNGRNVKIIPDKDNHVCFMEKWRIETSSIHYYISSFVFCYEHLIKLDKMDYQSPKFHLNLSFDSNRLSVSRLETISYCLSILFSFFQYLNRIFFFFFVTRWISFELYFEQDTVRKNVARMQHRARKDKYLLSGYFLTLFHRQDNDAQFTGGIISRASVKIRRKKYVRPNRERNVR